MRLKPQSNKDQQAVTELKRDVTDLKSNMANTVVSIQETQKNMSDSPLAIHYKGITITPGGFLAAEIAVALTCLGGGRQYSVQRV